MLCRWGRLVATVLLLACLSGCRNASAPAAPVHDNLERAAEPQPTAKIESVGMYIDVTPSMAGFLNNPYSTGNTLYSLCLNKLGVLLAGKYAQTIYYRVDTPLWRVDGPEDVLEEARHASYYQRTEDINSGQYSPIGTQGGYDSPCLTAALEEGRNQDLFILITDLYENSTGKNANANALANKIQELASSDDGKVFGLIGIKSIFSGTIYDIGPDGGSIDYGKDCLAYRSFYILLRGYPEHVQTFCQDMESRLKEHDAQKGKHYEITVFGERPFVSLDYTAFTECANLITNSKKKKSLWLDDAVVVVNAGKMQEGGTELPVYGYRKDTSSTFGGILYFAYSVAPERQEEFHALAEKAGERKTVNFLPNGETELYELSCHAQELTVSRWDGEAAFTAENKSGFFEVCGLYYDEDAEILYVGLRLEDAQLTPGLWRLQWKNMWKESGAEGNPWWQQWYTPSGETADYSKTERLLDYMEPILENAYGIEQSVLDAAVYLNIEEG